MNIWDEDVRLKTDDVIKLIEEQFQSIKVEEIHLMASGFDNNVYRVNNQYLFRFPRRKIANKLIQKEGRILPILKQRLSIAVPNPVFYGDPASCYPYDFLGYEYLNGLSIEEIATINSIDSIDILANFLAQLHSVPINSVKSIVGYDDLDRLNVMKRKDTLIKNTNTIKKMGIYETSKLEIYIDNLTDIKLDDEKVLLHGDLHIRNLLYNNNGVISAVIDFGDIHIGHKALDLSIVYSIIPKEFRSAFFEKYGKVSQATLDFARFKSIFTNVFIILHAHDLKNIGLIEKAIFSLDNAMS